MVGHLERRDLADRLEILASGDPEVGVRFAGISPEVLAESIHLVAPDGQVSRGAEAFERVIGLLPRGRMASWVFGIPLARPLAERVYRWVARNRHRLGCGAH